MGKWLVIMIAAGCGVDNLGVLAVTFDLNPPAPDQVIAGVDVRAYAAGSGLVDIDVSADLGMIHAQGLPALHEKSTYRAVVFLAPTEREALPTAAPLLVHSGARRFHEKLVKGVPELNVGLQDLDSVTIGSLELTGNQWLVHFSQASIAPHPLGAIRGAVVLLADELDRAQPILVLWGTVGGDQEETIDETTEKPKEHVHGA